MIQLLWLVLCVVFGIIDYPLALYVGPNFDKSITDQLVYEFDKMANYLLCKYVLTMIIEIFYYLLIF